MPREDHGDGLVAIERIEPDAGLAGIVVNVGPHVQFEEPGDPGQRQKPGGPDALHEERHDADVGGAFESVHMKTLRERRLDGRRFDLPMKKEELIPTLRTNCREIRALAQSEALGKFRRLDCCRNHMLQRRRPEGVRDFGLGDVVVRAGGAATVADVARAFEIVDDAGFERVGFADGFHREVHDLEARAAQTERTDGAVFRKGARRELHVTARAGADRIEAADGSVFCGNGGEDRAADFARGCDRAEESGFARRGGNVGTIRPKRERALHEREGIHRTKHRCVAARSRERGRDDDAAEAVTHDMNANTIARGLLNLAQKRVATAFAERSRAIFHLPKRQRAQRREQSAEAAASRN